MNNDETIYQKLELMQDLLADPSRPVPQVRSPALQRLMDEVRREAEEGVTNTNDPNAYNRQHNRHNRSGDYNRQHNRHNR